MVLWLMVLTGHKSALADTQSHRCALPAQQSAPSVLGEMAPCRGWAVFVTRDKQSQALLSVDRIGSCLKTGQHSIFFNYTFISAYEIYFFIPYQRYCFGYFVCATEFRCQLLL